MKKISLFTLFLLLLSHQSSASLIQLNYEHFYSPVSPTNFPVDTSGFVSFIFDGDTADQNLDVNEGLFKDPIKTGQMYLSGTHYNIDVGQPTEFSTLYSGRSYLKAAGTISNVALGMSRAFSLYLGGDLSPTIGSSLNNLQLNGFELHLIVFDPSVPLNSPEYLASYASYENGGVQLATLPEPASIILLIFGLAGIVILRARKGQDV